MIVILYVNKVKVTNRNPSVEIKNNEEGQYVSEWRF